MEKFEFNFDAIEIEAHAIVCNEDGTHRYEPWDFDSDGAVPDVWSVFGHAAGNHIEIGSEWGRKLIADCESAEAADALAGLVGAHIRSLNSTPGTPGYTGEPVPVYWYTKGPK